MRESPCTFSTNFTEHSRHKKFPTNKIFPLGTSWINNGLGSKADGEDELLELSESFRRNAAICLRWAHEARGPEDQAMWLGMAQHWTRLAQFAEEQRERPDAGIMVDLAPDDTSAVRGPKSSD